MLPFREEFARISIPVLTVTGYYSSGCRAASLYYFTQHHQHNARANHALLIGPYDDQGVERRPAHCLRGFQLDSAAIVELHEAWYEWFDPCVEGCEASGAAECERELSAGGLERVAPHGVDRRAQHQAVALLSDRIRLGQQRPEPARRIGAGGEAVASCRRPSTCRTAATSAGRPRGARYSGR